MRCAFHFNCLPRARLQFLPVLNPHLHLLEIEKRKVYVYEYRPPVTSVQSELPVAPPTSFVMNQNYPNPFNAQTSISYSIPRYSHVRLQIFNLLGQLMETLVDEEKPIGGYSARWDAANRSSGLYLYRITAGNFVPTRKALVLK